MKYRRSEAKDYARAHMKGIWAAALVPFADGPLDRRGGLPPQPAALGRRPRHRRHFRRRQAERVLLDVGRRAQALVRDHRRRDRQPRRHDRVVLRSEHGRDDRACQARPGGRLRNTSWCTRRCCTSCTSRTRRSTSTTRRSASRSTSASRCGATRTRGYLMSPELCARIAELPNIVAIKYSVPREMYARLTRLAGDKLIVSTASEEEWFDNIVELGWRLYLCSSPPYLFQTKADRRMREYTDLAFAGEVARPKPSATASTRCARRSAARARPRSRRRIPNTGRSCSARSADGCGRRCWN